MRAFPVASSRGNTTGIDGDDGKEPGCVKHAGNTGLSHGLLAASCAACYRTTGFSLLSGSEGPKHVFEVLVSRFCGE